MTSFAITGWSLFLLTVAVMVRRGFVWRKRFGMRLISMNKAETHQLWREWVVGRGYLFRVKCILCTEETSGYLSKSDAIAGFRPHMCANEW